MKKRVIFSKFRTYNCAPILLVFLFVLASISLYEIFVSDDVNNQLISNPVDNLENLNTLFERLNLSERESFIERWNILNLPKQEPKIKYEELRLRLYQNTVHLSNFVHWRISHIKKNVSLYNELMLRNFSEVFNEYIRFNLKDISTISEVDGFEDWRQQKREYLEDLVKRRLDYIQNPGDFKHAKKLLCLPTTHCGFTSQVHQFMQCLLAAYGTERTMVLQENWSDSNFTWTDAFIPVFEEYTLEENDSWSYWPGDQGSQVIVFKGLYHTILTPPYLPLYLPEDLAPVIFRTHLHPMAWWLGQFLKYLWQLRPEIQVMIKQWEKAIGFEKPVIGIHVRRTDKIEYKESRYHPIEEYMDQVEEFYKLYKLDHPLEKKQIYIATDEPAVFNEVQQKYSSYTIIGNDSISQTAGPASRNTNVSLHGTIKDIHILSLTDFVVCDYSSNVCRLLYAMRQYQSKNAIYQFYSVGRLYDQFGTLHKAIYQHSPSNLWELELQVDDTIRNEDYLSNGSSFGTNLRTNARGIYPTAKVIPFADTYNFPTYPQVPLKDEM